MGREIHRANSRSENFLVVRDTGSVISSRPLRAKRELAFVERTYAGVDEPKTPLVTVVVPVFNTGSYLEECLESIKRQTYANWEAVIIDNRSSDRSGEIADRYAALDKRFRVEHCEEFLSQLGNYNRGLSRISNEAKYCKMVEADNWLFPNCLEQMVSIAETDADITVVGSYYLHGTRVRGDGLPYSDQVLDGKTVCRLQLLDGYYFWGSPSSLLYSASVVRERARFFDEGALHADVDVCYEILEKSKFGFVHQVLAYIREDNEGVSRSIATYNSHLLSHVMDLHRYGSRYLSEEELALATRREERIYHNYLGLNWIFRRSAKGFWEHHEKGLTKAGINLDKRRLPWWALRGLVEEGLLEPKVVLEWFRRSVTGSRGRQRSSRIGARRRRETASHAVRVDRGSRPTEKM
jgi:glycosyltransferase involved in cell wall biosynthesis